MSKTRKSKKFKDAPKGRNPKYDKTKLKDKIEEKVNDKNSSCSYDNDPMWYALTEQLLQQFDSWSYDDVIGIPTRINAHPFDAATFSNQLSVAGIMSIELYPTIGEQSAPGSYVKTAIGDASQRIYTVLSASNGKTTKYLPEDPALVILMLGDITSMSAVFWRLVGIRNLFSARNRLVPNELIKSMGFRSENFLKKISDSIERYNNIVARLNGISMFADIPYFEKCNELYSHIFFDKGSAMGQLYVTKPAGWFRYTDGEIDPDTGFFTGNKLEYNLWEGLLDIDDFLDIMEHQVDDMLKSSLFNYVYSDIIREIRRNGGQVYQFSLLDLGYIKMPEFSEVFMTQIHNMSWGAIKTLEGYTITDDVNNLDLKDNLSYDYESLSELRRLRCGDQVIDFPYTDNPDYRIMAEALAFKSFTDSLITEGAAAGEVMDVAIPDHAIYQVKMKYVAASSGSVAEVPLDYVQTRSSYMANLVRGYDSFDVKPFIIVGGANDTDDGIGRILGNLNFWTTISTNKAQRIFRQSFLKLFSPKFLDQNASITTVANAK